MLFTLNPGLTTALCNLFIGSHDALRELQDISNLAIAYQWYQEQEDMEHISGQIGILLTAINEWLDNTNIGTAPIQREPPWRVVTSGADQYIQITLHPNYA
jgi:predicted GH43/DUF377 family glycosyl hydrolase